jgi:hypothetical protein
MKLPMGLQFCVLGLDNNELMEDGLHVVWNRRPRLVRKQGLLVLDSYEDHLTLDARSVIHNNEY